MTNTDSKFDRESYLNEAGAIILEEIIHPHCTNPSQHEWRASVGFPSGKPSKVIAQCWVSQASDAGINEIFVTPTIDDTMAILEALTHELVHQSDDAASGHKGHFARVARLIGLEGKLTATYAGDALKERLQAIIDVLGNIPHAKITPSKSGIKKQKSRMIKFACPSCEFNYRITRSNIEQIKILDCPACDADNMVEC
tara:strand:- start:1101 stop:1694 length:594 start_codon:yes stop_codon:yes gene_type:complete